MLNRSDQLMASTDEDKTLCTCISLTGPWCVALLQFVIHVMRQLVVQDEGLMRSGIWLVEGGSSSSPAACSCCRLSLGKCLYCPGLLNFTSSAVFTVKPLHLTCSCIVTCCSVTSSWFLLLSLHISLKSVLFMSVFFCLSCSAPSRVCTRWPLHPPEPLPQHHLQLQLAAAVSPAGLYLRPLPHAGLVPVSDF